MAITTLFQTGMVKHLADPPIEGFESDKVNASDLAYSWGMPDSPLSIASHAAAITLAGAGATLAALPAAATAARYLFHDMPVREKGWCPYCIAVALAHLAVLGFTLWESKQAIDRLRRG